MGFKGIVHPKITILSSFSHPHVISNMYDFLSFVYHEMIIWEMSQQFFYIMKINDNQNSLITNLLQNICRRKQVIQTTDSSVIK